MHIDLRMHKWWAPPQVCTYFSFKNTTHSQRFPPLFPTCTFSLFSSPAPFLSQPAVQINNQALKWRKETSPMTARGKSSSNYTTKHCLSIFCLTVILLSVLLLLTLLLWHSSLLFLLLLNFNQHHKELKKHFSSFALHLLMWNTDWNWSILSLFSHHHLSPPFLKFCLFSVCYHSLICTIFFCLVITVILFSIASDFLLISQQLGKEVDTIFSIISNSVLDWGF